MGSQVFPRQDKWCAGNIVGRKVGFCHNSQVPGREELFIYLRFINGNGYGKGSSEQSYVLLKRLRIYTYIQGRVSRIKRQLHRYDLYAVQSCVARRFYPNFDSDGMK